MKPLKQTSLFVLALLTAAPLAAASPAGSSAQEPPDWVTRSNANSQVLLDIMARLSPEMAGRFGVNGLEEEISSMPLDQSERTISALQAGVAELQQRLATETDPAVSQDLEILIQAAQNNIETTKITDRYMLAYVNAPQMVFYGIRFILDERFPPETYPAALVRLKRYAGMEDGYVPYTEQVMAYIRNQMKNPELRGPFRDELEKDMNNSGRFIDGIGQLFQKFGIEGYEPAYAELKKQMAAYETFLKDELSPRARDDFKLPREMYADNLKNTGVDMPVDELVSRAKTSFREIQNEMQVLAPLVAEKRGWKERDYRDVIRRLKQDQFQGDAIMDHYKGRIKDMERLIQEHHVVTLPNREMAFRFATDAEAAGLPAPHMDPPRFLGNTGELGAFVLPLTVPNKEGDKTESFDDFTFPAASWTLTAHEGRPGHELQFASIVEKGVSQARVLFAMNSVNMEGWGLYAESEMQPYEPLDGQLICLQHRLMRAARAFLDPGLQLGTITREEAYRTLEEDVVLSHPMATQEVERYCFWAPGQATAYFCGYSRLMEMRTDVEQALGKDFDRQSYHDFILAQGLLPPALMKKAVWEGYVKPRLDAKPKG